MNYSTKSKSAKFIAGLLGFAMALSLVGVTPASAQSTADLTAQINGLLATIAQLQAKLGGMSTTGGTSMTAGYTFSTNLTIGSKGTDVMNLQKLLNSNPATQVAVTGAGSPGNETSTFGNATKAAVIKFQVWKGITPAAGYVGALTRAALNAWSGSMTTGGTTGGTTPTPTPSATGPVSVSLSSDNPVSGYVIDNQATADLLHVTFTGSGTVTSVTLHRSGISDQNTLSNVYLYDGVNRITDGYSFNIAGDIVINGLNIAVNGSKTIAIKADASAHADDNSTIAVALTSFTASGTTLSAGVMGNLFNLASGASLATASLAANTAAGGPSGTVSVNAGTTAYPFWTAAIQINTRAVWLKAANFKMVGSAPSDALSHITLYVDGVATPAMATVMQINGSNYAVFDLSAAPLSLQTGSHTLDVRANIEKGSFRTVQFSVQQAADLTITDPQVGVNLAVTTQGQTIYTTNNAGTVNIATGSATIVQDPVFQAITNVTGGASNVAIAKFKVHAYGEDTKVQSLVVHPSFPTTPAQGNNGLKQVTLYFNGSQIGSQQDWTPAGPDITFNLGSQLIAPAGQDSSLEIRANLQTSTSTNYTSGVVRADLAQGSSNGLGQSSQNTFNFPTALVQGTPLTIQTGLLALSPNNGYSNQNANPNTSGVKIGSFSLQNQSSSESVRVTSLKVDLSGSASPFVSATGGLTNLSGLRTSETSGSGSTPVQPQLTNTFSVDFTLAPGATKTIDIFADTSAATGVNVVSTLTVTSIGSISNVSATSLPTAGQTITLQTGVLGTPTILTANSTQAQYIAAGNVAGATDATDAQYNFVSAGGASTITELKFTVTSSTGTPVSNIKVGGQSAPVVGGVAYFTGLNLAVPNGGSGLAQDVKVSYSSVGTNGTIPGATSTVALAFVKYTSGGMTSTECTAAIASCTTVLPVGGIVAPTMTLVGSKPTVTVNTSVASGLILSTENKIGEVTISADAQGNIKVNDIKFAVGSSNISGFAIVNPRIADGTVTVTGSQCGASGSSILCEFGTAGDTFVATSSAANTESNLDFDGYQIAANSSKTLSLYGTVNGTVATSGGFTSVSTSVDPAGFNWDDTSYASFAGNGVTASPSAGTNLTGTTPGVIYNFPTGSYSIKQ